MVLLGWMDGWDGAASQRMELLLQHASLFHHPLTPPLVGLLVMNAEGPPDCGLLRESDMGPEEGPIKQRQTARQHAILPPQQGLTRFTQPAAHSSLSRPPTFCPTPVRREKIRNDGAP